LLISDAKVRKIFLNVANTSNKYLQFIAILTNQK